MHLATTGLTAKFLGRLNPNELAFLNFREWPVFAGLPQRPPLRNWRTWLLLGGRGAGKTRAGAEWLKAIIGRDAHFTGDAAGRVAIVGETYADARAVMIEGESGLLALYQRNDRPSWNPSRRQLEWSDGTIGQVFSASDPEGLRGSQFGAAWSDAITIWGSLVSASAAFTTLMAVLPNARTESEYARALVSIIGAAGSLVAIHGRISARRPIS
jgi:phage terminase large subunit-like protein